MGIEAGILEERRHGVDVLLLVTVGVSLRVGRAGTERPSVVVGDVGGQTTNGRGGTGVGVDFGEECCGGAQVGGPSEPSSMA
jgi:hypothetical protein